MLLYQVTSLPDLTLSKYQISADSGVDSMLEAQTRFLRQVYRFAAYAGISIHFLYDYDPERSAGIKLNIYLAFSSQNDITRYAQSLDKIVRSSSIADHFKLTKLSVEKPEHQPFSFCASMRKKERNLQTVFNGAERTFYIVPNWEVNKEARLFSLFKLMDTFDERCCYRVDLYPVDGLNETIHRNFERPLGFLRGSNSVRTGLESHDNRYSATKDPNVTETLEQYEKWMKSIDSSNAFRCRISAYTNEIQYARLLLDTAFSEAVEVGNNSIQIRQGSSDWMDNLDQRPMHDCLENTPQSMEDWPTTYTTEEIAAFARLPILYDGEDIELPKETAVALTEEGVDLGKDRNGHAVHISEKMFAKHMFVCGVPGSGKTNTMLLIADNLWNTEKKNAEGEKEKLHVPFLVLEPAKREYRELALFDIPELLIFSPSACTNFPLKINPFEFPKGLTLSEHIRKLSQVFEGAFPIDPPAPFILDRAIQGVYEKHGWNSGDINIGAKEYPTMSELYAQFEDELLKTNYDSEIRGNIQSVLQMRIGSLLRREMKDIFDVRRSTLAPEEWMKYPVVIELEALGEGPANFVTLLLCTLIRETLRTDPLPSNNKPIRHVIIIEEAHNLIAPQAQVQSGRDSNPKIAATQYIVQMLAEVRALREGIIIADQLPTAMAPEVIKNTNIKLVHRLTSQDDRELVGGTMAASPLQMENMAIYTSGQALFTLEKMLRPMQVQVHCVEGHGEVTPDDDRLLQLMMDPAKKPGYYRIRKREAERLWDGLKKKVQMLLEKEDRAVSQLREFKKQHLSLAQFERCSDDCLNVLEGLKKMGQQVYFECGRVDSFFIENSRVKEMRRIALAIGDNYERSVEQFIINF